MRCVTLGAAVAALLLSGVTGLQVDHGVTRAQAQGADTENPLAGVKMGLCDMDKTFALALHGGVVFWRGDHGPKIGFLRQALSEARAVLASGARAIDVVEAVVADMENSGLFNAGKGAIANEAGVVEMDASIMEGRLLEAGAVASVKAVRNPISAARLVMDSSRHVMMVGPGADSFVQENGGAVADAAYFFYSGRNFGNVPLPGDMEIKPPDDRIAPDKTAFSGAWAGIFTGTLNHVLVVEEMEPDRAKVIYAFGPHPIFGESLYRRLTAVFVDGGLQVTEPDDMSALGSYVVTYRLNPDGTLSATAKKKGSAQIDKMTLRRLTDPGGGHNGGTVGAVVRDRCGNLAAGTSTGGFDSKIPGRVGDSPIIGAGTYANNETAAISATGHGEFFMRHVVAHAIAAAMKYKGLSVQDAATNLIKGELLRKGLRGGVIAVDRDGNIATPYNTEGMVRGVTSSDLAPKVEVY
ncbi:MAG: isoaspartyl peptidase/L-asparaginase family protein [Hyphomicrobiales bacterium]